MRTSWANLAESVSWDFADEGCRAHYIAGGRRFRYRRCGEPDGEFGTGVLECVTCYRRVSLTLGAVFDGTRRSLGLSVHAAGVFSTDREESRRASSSSNTVQLGGRIVARGGPVGWGQSA